ncbi:hypothetical protein [Cryobacterium sp. Y82]|uniref:hypothetical protein n=1 Tax=Cryobacterium sp. Y82 TaxID=2045017 RepID=UPI000CE4E249|nr:hypothetical protein [Cryobacterium sp. Y82]
MARIELLPGVTSLNGFTRVGSTFVDIGSGGESQGLRGVARPSVAPVVRVEINMFTRPETPILPARSKVASDRVLVTYVRAAADAPLPTFVRAGRAAGA